MPKQVAEEYTHFLLPDVSEPKLAVKTEVLSLGTDRDARDGGDFIPPVAMAKDWSEAARSPGLDHAGDQEES